MAFQSSKLPTSNWYLTNSIRLADCHSSAITISPLTMIIIKSKNNIFSLSFLGNICIFAIASLFSPIFSKLCYNRL